MKLMNKLAFGMSLLVVAQNALAIAISAGYRDFRSKSVPKCLSGITYAGVEGGKNIFYAVADNGADIGLYKVTIGGFNSDGDVSGTPSVGSRVQLAGATDIEGVAYDPASGHVWVADEGKQTITEYNPSTGEALRQAPVPAVLGTSKIVGNYGFESLTISGDGLAMWTANEEALTIDGERSSFDSGTVVRLVKFARTTVNDEWKLAAMYAYKTDKWHNRYGLGGSGRRGVSDLCALPDGSLLVLERELSSTMSGTSVDAKVSGLFYCEIYQVTPASLAAATDVCSYDEGLKTRTGWSVVQKTRLYSLTTKGSVYYISWSNIEGLCLGPRHSSGGTVLMGVSDAGDGTTNAEWVPFVMTGLNIRTLEFNVPSSGVSTIVGTNYRYLNGASVKVSISGVGDNAGWTLTNHTPASGTGKSATFTVASDATFAWQVADMPTTSVTATSYSGFYDGQYHTVGVSVTKPAGSGEATVTYSASPSGPFVPLTQFVQQKDVTKDGPVTVYVKAEVPNCQPSTDSATVTVKARPVTLLAGSAQKPYDQKELTCETWSVKSDTATAGYGFVGSEGIASLRMKSTSTQTTVGSHANEIDPSTVTAKSGTDLGNYIFSYESGTLTVTTGSGVTVTATDYEGYYDGKGHTIGVSASKPAGSGGATITYSTSPSGPFVPLAQFVQQKNVTKYGPVTVYVKAEVPNYASATANATVTITPCPVIIRAGSGEKSFDRTPFSVGDYEALGFADGEGVADLKMLADSTITLPGTRINVIDESSVTFIDGTDVDNYDITYLGGELKVLPGMGVGGVDTFEENQEGATADSLENWQGEDASIVLENYDVPTPPGHVTTLATHTRVLDATGGEAVRIVPEGSEEKEKIDVMVCIQCPAKPLKPLSDDIQLRVAADEQGRLCLWHLYEGDGEWKKDWIPLSETIYMNGEWVRLGIDLDYTSNPAGDAFAKVTVNGSCQPTAHGVRSPTDLRAYGPWHYLAKNRRTGGVSMPSEISFAGTKVDDLMLCKKTVAPEHTGATSVDGIEFAWFDNMGLPRNPTAAAPFIPGYTLGDVYAAGLDPYSNRPLEVTGFELDASGRPHIEINGYKGETPVGYRVLYSPTPDFKNATMLGTSDGAFDGDAASWSTTWDGKAEVGRETGFYKIEAFR